jgi:type IV pilus assembly protein PilQ
MHGRIPRLVLAAPIVAALAVSMAASGRSPITGSTADSPALRSISSRLDGAVSTVLIEASEPVAYLTSQPDPLTVLVDLRNVKAASLSDEPGGMLAPVAGVDIENATAPDGSPVARVRVRLDRAATHRVRSSRNLILVEVDRAAATAAKTADTQAVATPQRLPSLAPRAPQRAAAAVATSAAAPTTGAARVAATELRAITASELPNGYAITLSGNGPLLASSVQEARDLPARVLLDFQGVGMGGLAPVTAINSAGIERVRVATNSRDPLITRVVIDLARTLPYTVESVGEELRILFNRAVDATAAMIAAAPAAPAAPPAAQPPVVTAVAAEAVQTPQTLVPVPGSLAALAAAPPAQAATPAVQSPLQPQTNAQGQRMFSGDPVTLDFQGADLRAVLRTFAEISGLNIVIDPAIQGTVDVSLRDVPWDQALDIILRANKLGYSVDGTIVRIVPLTVLAQENEDRRKLSDATALAGELRIITRPLSYAKAADLVPIITRSTLSTRGDVQIDTRTNTLIIRDLADRLAAASELLTTLDRPQPQVEIEARIVQTSRDFARSLGVQWGFNGRVDPAVGTSTGLAFPNSGALGGRTGVDVNGSDVSNVVNLPASGVNSAVGIALGSINGALNLDVALTALESTGKGRLLSTPRVSTQNNIEAEITQGTQIPYQTTSNNTVTVAFKDAALTLKVTPQITASNTVILRIFMENASANFNQTVGTDRIPSIDTQRAVTTVLVADGDTTVIGGIYQSTEFSTNGRTPLLHRIPLLGWLFRNEDTREESQELLIFITPKIAK